MSAVSPNKPKTPHRSVRIPDELWVRSQDRAKADGTTVSALINQWLESYVEAQNPIDPTSQSANE